MTPLERAVLEAATREGVVGRGFVEQAVLRRDALSAAGKPRELLSLVAEGCGPAQVARLRALHSYAMTAITTPPPPDRLPAQPATPTPPGGARRTGRRKVSEGDVVGPYVLERELGRGGMGVVFAATHQVLERKAALKLSLCEGDGDPRFEREVQALAKLRHPAIVEVFDAGLDGLGRRYLAMALVDGEPLRRRLDRDGPLDGPTAARLGAVIARGLEHAHGQGILHRDLKPDNVLIERDGAPRLVDFGLATADAAEERLTRTGDVMGTPSYMAPEQAAGERRSVGPATDVYGVGAILFHALTGQPPFGGESVMNIVSAVITRSPPRPSSLRPGVDPELEAIVLRCLEKSPAHRPASAEALAVELEAWLARATAPGGARRRGPRAGAIVGAGAALAAGIALGGLLLRPAPPAAPAAQVAGIDAQDRPGRPDVAPAPSASAAAPATGLPAGFRLGTVGRRIVVDRASFPAITHLEVGDPWTASLLDDGLRLRATHANRMRTGLGLALQRAAPGDLVLRARLRLESLEPPHRVALVWSDEAGTVGAGVAPVWVRGADGGEALALRPVLASSVAPGGRDLRTAEGEPVLVKAWPVELELELRLELDPPRVRVTWTDDALPPLAGDLGVAPGRDGYLLVTPAARERLPAAGPAIAYTSIGEPPALSSLVVRRLEAESSSGPLRTVADPSPWARLGRAGRDLLLPERRADALAALRQTGAAPHSPQLADHVDWASALALIEGPVTRPRGEELLRAMARDPDPDRVGLFWGHVTRDWFALDPAQRDAVAAVARAEGRERYALGPDARLVDVAQSITGGAEGTRDLPGRWGVAAAWLHGAGEAPQAALVAAVLSSDLPGALALAPAREGASPTTRAWCGLAAHRLGRLDEARAWWSGLDPASEELKGLRWLARLAPR